MRAIIFNINCILYGSSQRKGNNKTSEENFELHTDDSSGNKTCVLPITIIMKIKKEGHIIAKLQFLRFGQWKTMESSRLMANQKMAKEYNE